MKKAFLVITVLIAIMCGRNISCAELTIGSVAHIKGQETNTLTGLGLVVGLAGTGDSGKDSRETIRSLARFMERLGHGGVNVEEMLKTRNVALVTVTATVPGTGAREGSLIDCHVAAIGGAKSLKGGQLMVTPLTGPKPARFPEMPIVYALATGMLALEDPEVPTTARISDGCKLEDDFYNPFVKDGVITIVIDDRYASWEMACAIADAVDQESPDGTRRARAINQKEVTVMLPEYEDPVRFIADFMKNEPLINFKIPTIVINKRAGKIAVDGNVEITPTAISYNGMTINIAPPPAGGDQAQAQPAQGQQAQANPPTQQRFVGIDTESTRNKVENARLDALLESLNAINVPEKDIIEIIENLDTMGNIHGRIIYH